MTFNEWLERYIPMGYQNKALDKAGLCKNQVSRWKRGVKPNTTSIIYLSKALCIMFDYDYKTIVIQGMRAAAGDELWINSLKNITPKK
tara:strand:- start:200 stop:463 length:264 start_codon:yes stop_codon:yes gene_type:complete